MQTAPLIYLKANIECLRGNYRKAIKVLNSTPAPTKEPSVSGVHLAMMHYNNLGVIHFMMRKHHMGAHYFKQAITENTDCVQDLCKMNLGKCVAVREELPNRTAGLNWEGDSIINTTLLYFAKIADNNIKKNPPNFVSRSESEWSFVALPVCESALRAAL